MRNGGNGSSIGNGNGNGGVMGRGKVRAESVIEAATLAANGQPFEVVYYPRASMPEFCVKAVMVKAAFQIWWCLGMRFKMAFETEDSSRISWFMGTISSVQVADPIRWPDSPWRLLQVRHWGSSKLVLLQYLLIAVETHCSCLDRDLLRLSLFEFWEVLVNGKM